MRGRLWLCDASIVRRTAAEQLRYLAESERRAPLAREVPVVVTFSPAAEVRREDVKVSTAP